VADGHLSDHSGLRVGQGCQQVDSGLSAVLGATDFFAVDGHHDRGLLFAVAVTDMSQSPTAEQPIQQVGIDQAQDPADGLFRGDPVTNPGQFAGVDIGPVTDRGERLRAGGDGTHPDHEHIDELVADPAWLTRIGHTSQNLTQILEVVWGVGGGEVAVQDVHRGR
jgi:hypothetical protein